MATAPAIPAARRTGLVPAGVAVIVLATLLAYIPAIGAGFIWDDDQYVTDNRLLRDADGLRLIWTRLGATPQYYPLTHTSFWVEYQQFGANPLPYHLNNVLLHIASALLLWRILAMLDLRGAWLAAAVFAMHPIEVESVAWVTERKNVLSGVLYLAAMLAYLRAAGIGTGGDGVGRLAGPRWGGYVVSLLLFVAAVLSKTVAASLPAAIVLILWWKLGKIPWRQVGWLLPMFVIGIGFGALTGYMERTYVGAVGPEWDFDLLERMLIAGRATWFYVWKLLVPHHLTFIYPRWTIDSSAAWRYLFPAAAAGVIAVLFALRRRVGRGPVVGVLFYVGTLFPAMGFANVYPMRFSFVADHFQYLAGIGLIVLFSELIVRGLSAVRVNLAWAAALPVMFGALTWRQAQMYRDVRTLWETTVERNPDAWIAHDHLGALLATDDPEAAAGHYATAIELEPDHIEAYIGMGNLLLQLGRPLDAADEYRRAIDVRPDKPTPHYALGGALAAAGQLSDASAAYEKALEVDPQFIPARLKLAELYTRLGRGDDAARQRRLAEEQFRTLRGE